MTTTAEATAEQLFSENAALPATPASIKSLLVEAYEAGVRDTMAMRGKSPHRPGRRPFGFWAGERATLAVILELAAWGDLEPGKSQQTIADYLNDSRQFRRHGSRWTRQAVGRVLAAQAAS